MSQTQRHCRHGFFTSFLVTQWKSFFFVKQAVFHCNTCFLSKNSQEWPSNCFVLISWWFLFQNAELFFFFFEKIKESKFNKKTALLGFEPTTFWKAGQRVPIRPHKHEPQQIDRRKTFKKVQIHSRKSSTSATKKVEFVALLGANQL